MDRMVAIDHVTSILVELECVLPKVDVMSTARVPLAWNLLASPNCAQRRRLYGYDKCTIRVIKSI